MWKWTRENRPDTQEESAGNAYLRDENKRLHQENGKLHDIFRIATIEFEKRDMKIASLGEQLEIARMRIRRLEEENAFLRAELEGAIIRPGPPVNRGYVFPYSNLPAQ